MIIEYASHDLSISDQELKNQLTEIIKYDNLSTVSVLYPQIKAAKTVVNDASHVLLSAVIDFPLGCLDTKQRVELIQNSIENKIDIIELVCPMHLVVNRKYDKLRQDIKQASLICTENNIELRYILDYRIYSYNLMYKICQILIENNIKIAYPATGYFLDNINDNILAAALINQKVPAIKIICNGNIWTKDHISLVKKSPVHGVRVPNLSCVRLLHEN